MPSGPLVAPPDGAGRLAADGCEVDAMAGHSGVAIGEQDVSPPAELGEQAGRGLVEAEEEQRHPARRLPCVRGLAEPVQTPAVLDYHHAQTIMNEHPIKPTVGQIQGGE